MLSKGFKVQSCLVCACVLWGWRIQDIFFAKPFDVDSLNINIGSVSFSDLWFQCGRVTVFVSLCSLYTHPCALLHAWERPSLPPNVCCMYSMFAIKSQRLPPPAATTSAATTAATATIAAVTSAATTSAAATGP
jgi:hypothetical protein